MALIRQNPQICQKDLAKRLGIERSSVAVHIANLTRKGFIRGKGYILDSVPYVAVVGAANMDISGRSGGLVDRESNIGRIRLSAGGVARNIAEVIARLDIPVSLLSAVGDDAHGQSILEECRRQAIDISRVHQDSSLPTSIYMAFLAADGDMQVAVNDMAVAGRIDAHYIRQHRNFIKNAAVVVVDANLSEAALEAVMETGQPRILADPVSAIKAARLKPWLSALYAVKPNRAEAEVLTGIKVDSRAAAVAVIRDLHQQGLQQVYLSLGADGVLASDGQKIWLAHIKRPASAGLLGGVEPVMANTTGCGDVFLAVIATGLYRALPLAEALELAVAAADLNTRSEATIHEQLGLDLILAGRKDVQIEELMD